MYLDSTIADFFKNYGLYVVLALIVIIIALVAFLLIRNKSRNKNKSGLFEEIVEALGGQSNIVKMEAKMSRLIVELHNDAMADLEKLKVAGVARVIKMSNKMTLLIGNKASTIANKFNK